MAKISDIYRGDYKLYKIDLSSTGLDLSADIFFVAVKINADDDDPGVYQVKKSPPHNITHDTGKVDDPTNGVIYIPVPASDNAKLTPGDKYFIGFQWVRDTDKPKTLKVQTIKCLQDINISIS